MLIIILLTACNNAENSSTAVDNNKVDDTNSERDFNDATENDEDDEKEKGEYGHVFDITEITNDDRFIALGGTIQEMIESDEVIADNEHFRANLVRYIFLEENSTHVYQLEIENQFGGDITIEVISAQADEKEITDILKLDYGNYTSLDENETVYVTLYTMAAENELTNIDKLKVEVEVKEIYDVIGVYEIVID